MQSTPSPDKTLSAEQIAQIAEQGNDVLFLYEHRRNDDADSRHKSISVIKMSGKPNFTPQKRAAFALLP